MSSMLTMSSTRLALFLSGAIASVLLIATAPLEGQAAPGGTAAQQPSSDAAREELLAALVAAPPGDVPKPAEGQPAYEKLCAACHRFGELGTDVGPDLTTINSRFKKKDILESILWPSKIISDQYETFLIETTGGDIITGAVMLEDDQRLVVRTPQNPERPVQVAKSQIKTQQKSPLSLMPEELLTGMSHKEINALIAFLQAGPKNP
jgi:putative heme-binding domain-containing protein